MEGGGGNRYFPSGKAADTSAPSLSRLGRCQAVKKCFGDARAENLNNPPAALLFVVAESHHLHVV